ncbi:MAG TPA: antibiotic biosynthesis monooxygenase [Terracidiphilus sp.]
MKPVTQINVISIKPGKTEEYFAAQLGYLASIDLPPGLISIRMYKGTDGKSAVLVSKYESLEALQAVQQRAVLKQHIERIRPLIEAATPAVYEEVYAAEAFSQAKSDTLAPTSGEHV